MVAADPRPPESPPPLSAAWISIFETLARVPRVAALSIVGPVVLFFAAYFLWSGYFAKRLDLSRYALKKENILLTKQPPWIRTNVLEEVFEGSQLHRLSVLDHAMSQTVYSAFERHPWVRRVFRAQKLAGEQVEVLVEYREPLAMVYEELPAAVAQDASPATTRNSLTTNHPSRSKAMPVINFYPVDVDGILLPTEDFHPEEIPKYLLIYAQGSSPLGCKVGDEYGDSRIKSALLICRILRDVRSELGIERIYVYPDRESEGRWVFELTTASKHRVQWGHAPGQELTGEPGAPAKLRKLRDFLLRPLPEEVNQKSINLVSLATPKISKMLSNSLQQ